MTNPGPTTDVFTPEQRSAVMARVKGRNTKPELIVRKALTRLGARYRLHRKDLPGAPDVVMPGRGLAIFVHGCFWHGHDCARGARVPKANRDYWLGKIGRNRQRDARCQEALAALGWRVETIWECDLTDPAALETRLRMMLGQAMAAGQVGGGEARPRLGQTAITRPKNRTAATAAAASP